jgi:hypothetical protein
VLLRLCTFRATEFRDCFRFGRHGHHLCRVTAIASVSGGVTLRPCERAFDAVGVAAIEVQRGALAGKVVTVESRDISGRGECVCRLFHGSNVVLTGKHVKRESGAGEKTFVRLLAMLTGKHTIVFMKATKTATALTTAQDVTHLQSAEFDARSRAYGWHNFTGVGEMQPASHRKAADVLLYLYVSLDPFVPFSCDAVRYHVPEVL